jgi:hypothetical protein
MTTESYIAIGSTLINGGILSEYLSYLMNTGNIIRQQAGKNVKEHYEEVILPKKLGELGKQ